MFERCMKFVKVAEGGANFDVVNGKPVLKRSARNDRGGPTKYGITWGTLARAYSQGVVDHNDIVQLTRQEAVRIFEAFYWIPSRADRMSWGLCLAHFDTAVNSGVSGAGKMLQRAVNDLSIRKIAVDGIIGPDSLRAIGDLDQASLTKQQLSVRAAFFSGLVARDPGQGVFLQGWRLRIERLAKEAGVLSPNQFLISMEGRILGL